MQTEQWGAAHEFRSTRALTASQPQSAGSAPPYDRSCSLHPAQMALSRQLCKQAGCHGRDARYAPPRRVLTQTIEQDTRGVLLREILAAGEQFLQMLDGCLLVTGAGQGHGIVITDLRAARGSGRGLAQQF